MLSKYHKLRAMVDFGGLNYLFFKLQDKILGSDDAVEYSYKILENANPDDYPKLLQDMFMMVTGGVLDLNNPVTFNEKIQWLKLYDSTYLKTMLSDKYLVRQWIKEKIGDEYLVPLLGVWNTFGEIDFDSLPNKFFLKCNHGSGMNIAVEDKETFDKQKAKEQFDKWMATNYAFHIGLELQYKDIPRKILAEKYIEQMNSGLIDYKIHCFAGEPKIVQIIGDRDLIKHTAKECFLTPEWKQEDLMYHTYELYEQIPVRPSSIDKMLDIARTLSNGIRYVRVDLYDLEGIIKFGEMTFTPMGGYGKWKGSQASRVGSWIDL